MLVRKRRLSGWGNAPFTQAYEIQPDGLSDWEKLGNRSFLARGLGRSYGDASLPASGGVAINTEKFNRFIHWNSEQGILEAESGVTLTQILKTFVPRGFFLPVTPGTQYVTLGGAVASNVHGKNHHLSGSIENFITKLRVKTPIGIFDCSRDENQDLFHSTLSGYGLTGFIDRIHLQLRPIESSYIRFLSLRAKNLDALFKLFEKEDEEWEYSVAWLDTLARGKSLGRGVLMLGQHANAFELTQKEQDRHLEFQEPSVWSIPLYSPEFLLNKKFLRLFNYAYWRFSRTKPQSSIISYQQFFYPLDFIGNWNRLYGRRGFFQYQFMIPDPHGQEGIARCLEFLSRKGLGAFLSVLKRCGDDLSILPFCKKGFTLALDIPYRSREILKVLNEADEMVASYGGRVYLSKDARLSGEMFRSMYPEYQNFRVHLDKYNPNRIAWSRMAERLGL